MKKVCFFVLVCCFFSCSQKKSEVSFDSSFLSGKLDSVVKHTDNFYEVFIYPAFEPVNQSPWFAFSVASETKKQLTIKLNYGKYKHRYVPKISTDKKHWKPINSTNLYIDSLGNATITIISTPQKMFIAAQEIESTTDTYAWIDEILKEKSIKRTVIGKTVLKKDIYALEHDNDTVKKSIVLIARQHPPEIPGGSIGFKAFYLFLISNDKLALAFRKKFNIYTIPLLNPDGVDAGNWRHNANGVDLNRDWIDFSQPETIAVKNFINNKITEGKSINFAIDFHTSYSGPYMLVLDSVKNSTKNKIIPKWIENIQKESDFIVEARPRSQELPYCYNYFINTFNCEAITYEEGDEIDRDLIKQRAQWYAKNLIKTLLNDKEI
ncbi:M14 family metallopeptidase [Tenacibaculum crassostreae]|uniref:M14 family metallopeptidase n=1 Tax=Tenacibaculum crassostreae TaxID=502683 RepID=UPI0038957B98